MGVPILRLPFLALKVLVDHFENLELVTASLLSKRAGGVLKACGKNGFSFFNLPDSEIKYLRNIQIQELFLLESRRQKKLPEWNFQLFCTVSDEQHISISCRNFIIRIYFENLEDIEKFVGFRRNLKIGESIVPVVTTRENYGVEKIRTFWNSETDGMILFLNFFENKFNLLIEELTFAGKRSGAIRAIVNHINSTQTLVRKVLVSVHPPLSEDDFKFILENVSATECFRSHLVLSQNFKFNGTIRAKSIKIHYGHWFTLENLLVNTENEEIYVNGSDYARGELRTFLREWVSGRFPKLKEVNLATKVSYLDVTSGFERRRDKCDNTSRCPVVAIKGQGDFYGIVDPAKNGYGYFLMRVHRG